MLSLFNVACAAPRTLKHVDLNVDKSVEVRRFKSEYCRLERFLFSISNKYSIKDLLRNPIGLSVDSSKIIITLVIMIIHVF